MKTSCHSLQHLIQITVILKVLLIVWKIITLAAFTITPQSQKSFN